VLVGSTLQRGERERRARPIIDLQSENSTTQTKINFFGNFVKAVINRIVQTKQIFRVFFTKKKWYYQIVLLGAEGLILPSISVKIRIPLPNTPTLTFSHPRPLLSIPEQKPHT
jgi:hypothetical protein